MAGETGDDPPRDGRGKFTRSLKTAQRDHDALALKVKGWSLQRIANELGYASKGAVHNGIRRAFRDLPVAGADEEKRLDLERIDRLIELATEVMERSHVAYSNGQLIRRRVGVEVDDDGFERLDDKGKPIPVYEEVLDDGPLLAAIDRIRSLLERRDKIIGYGAPSRSRVEIITPEAIEARIAELEAELAVNDPADSGTA
jgi:hypothetical protein